MKKRLFMVMALSVLVLVLSAQVTPGYQPGDQSLIFVPTAYTMPAGLIAITDYEVAFVQVARSFSTNTHLSAISMLPVTSDFTKTITLGVKQRYLAHGIVQSSAFSSFTPDSRMFIVGNVVSLGQPYTSLHLGLLYGWQAGKSFDAPLFFVGGRKNLSKSVALMAEYGSATGSTDGTVQNIASFGIRFISNTISWDLGAIRPEGIDMGNLYFFPVLKATFEF